MYNILNLLNTLDFLKEKIHIFVFHDTISFFIGDAQTDAHFTCAMILICSLGCQLSDSFNKKYVIIYVALT